MINSELDMLFVEWRGEMERSGDMGFCYDGLVYRLNGGRHIEEELWANAPRRILFLLKEQNDNEGQDVREWSGSINGKTPNQNFFHRIGAWLYTLTNTTPTNHPTLSEAFDNQNLMRALTTYPYAYINLKKSTGGARSNDNQIYDYAQKYKHLLKRQIEILNPTIIYCCGDITFRALTEQILPQAELTPVSTDKWAYTDRKSKLVVINSFHPSASKSNEEMVMPMLRDFQKTL